MSAEARPAAAATTAPVLEIEQLTIRLPGPTGPITIVENVDYRIGAGEVFGIAGESGSGKTISMLGVMGLLPRDAEITGTARFEGRDLVKLPRSEVRKFCGKRVAMVFQDPSTCLHPMLTIEKQLTDHTRYHLGIGKSAARQRAMELLREVRIPDPEGALAAFPHQFSGGMRQRIAIAMALACEPKLLIADEPTTALDVTVQAGIIQLLGRLRDRAGLSVVLITHDLGVMSAIADRVHVFYAGRVVESGVTREVLGRPKHPYTRALIASQPRPNDERARLVPIRGTAPTPMARPPGCAFHPRCDMAEPPCRTKVPALLPVGTGCMLACPPLAREFS